MIILKCKMCGGNLNITSNTKIATCEYCGSTQLIPELSGERKQKLISLGDELRLSREYDRATAYYEKSLEEDNKDPNTYWSMVLCRFGVEYVDDIRTGNKIPTLNRTQASSILADSDYLKAMELSDEEQKEVLESEAGIINQIQKNIISVSNAEEPYDIFISYKETGADGQRTEDSVLAQELYESLEKEGYRVFFSRISLQDKLGRNYEPYIFNAINTARVMLVVGTSRENIESVWVKNEWSRFLHAMKKDENKIIIPAFKIMNPNDLPKEFSCLQALNMNRLGYIFDLKEVLMKIFRNRRKETAETAAVSNVEEPKKKNPFIAIALVLALIICGIAAVMINKTQSKDNSAINEKQPAEIIEEEEISNNPYKDLNVGDYVTIGSYKQNGNKEAPVSWIVLKKEQDKLLVLSEYVLICKPYNNSGNGSDKWSDASLRTWLNGEFLNKVFTEEEKQYLTTEMEKDVDGSYTEEKLFILSKDEIETYVPKNLRIAEGTEYAFESCGYKKEGKLVNLCYWVRSNGTSEKSIMDIDIYGNYYTKGYPVHYSDGVRVAMWIDCR